MPVVTGQQHNGGHQNLQLDTKSMLDKNYKPFKLDSKAAAVAADAKAALPAPSPTTHPLLYHVYRFAGGTQSYHVQLRVRDPQTCKVVAAYANGAPLVVEGPTPKSKKAGMGAKAGKCVVLNFYVCAARPFLPARQLSLSLCWVVFRCTAHHFAFERWQLAD
jgi:hypothetical protein